MIHDDVSKYTTERLEALWDRVDSLEHTIEEATGILEDDVRNPLDALEVLKGGIMQAFRSALLCCRDTTDEHLDEWLADAKAAEQGPGA